MNKAEQDLPVRKKEQRQRKLHLRREVRKRREKSIRADETSQEAQKRPKAQRQRDASRHQCQTAERRARRLLDQSEENALNYQSET